MTETEHRHTFEKWIGQYKTLIFKIVRAYAFTLMDRDDLFQEVIIQVWHSVPKFRHESAIATWLYRISLNTAIRWAKKERRLSQRQENLDKVEFTLLENTIHIDERLTWLYKEIAMLDEIDRSIMLLMLEGFSYKEMADIIGITESNIGVKINRIKKHLTIQSKKYDDHGI